MDTGPFWGIKTTPVDTYLWIIDQSVWNTETREAVLETVEWDDSVERFATDTDCSWLHVGCFGLQRLSGLCWANLLWAFRSSERDPVTSLKSTVNIFSTLLALVLLFEVNTFTLFIIVIVSHVFFLPSGIQSLSRALLQHISQRESGLNFYYSHIFSPCFMFQWSFILKILQMQGAMDLWRAMRKLGLKMNTVGYNSVLDSQVWPIWKQDCKWLLLWRTLSGKSKPNICPK